MSECVLELMNHYLQTDKGTSQGREVLAEIKTHSAQTDLWKHQNESHGLSGQCKNSFLLFQNTNKQFMQGTVSQLQCLPRKKELHISPIFFWHTTSFFWIFHQHDHHNKKRLSSNQPNSCHGQNHLLREIATDIHTSRWTICFGNSQNNRPQIMRSWSHSHKIAVRKPRCAPPYNHQDHQHRTGFWSCTTRLQNCYCQTPAQKTIPRPKCTEKNTVQSQTCHFCLKFLKRSFYINSLHTSKKTTSAILSNQPTAPDTAQRPHSYAL